MNLLRSGSSLTGEGDFWKEVHMRVANVAIWYFLIIITFQCYIWYTSCTWDTFGFCHKLFLVKVSMLDTQGSTYFSYIDHFRITAIWPGDRIHRPKHPAEIEVRRRSCDESVEYFSGTNFALITKYSIHIYHFIFDLDTFMK